MKYMQIIAVRIAKSASYLGNVGLDKWGVEQIEARADRIANRFLEVWPAPNVDVLADSTGDEVNIFDAEEPRFKRLDYAVFLGSRLQVTQVAKLYVEVFEQLLVLQPESLTRK